MIIYEQYIKENNVYMLKEKYSLDEIDVVMFDLDGTVYYGSQIIPGANETIRFFRKAGKTVVFTTNNSTKTRKQIYERLKKMGVDCCLNEVVTAGFLAAEYVKNSELQNVYIFGSINLMDEFREMGLTTKQDETAENLLIGYNPDMNYSALTEALQVALHAKCIIACNKERTFPGEGAKIMPGCGAMTAPIEWCAKRPCDLVIGKPNTFMVKYVSERFNVSKKRILVIGDTYESDVQMANNAGSKAILIDQFEKDDTIVVKTIASVPDVFIKES